MRGVVEIRGQGSIQQLEGPPSIDTGFRLRGQTGRRARAVRMFG